MIYTIDDNNEISGDYNYDDDLDGSDDHDVYEVIDDINGNDDDNSYDNDDDVDANNDHIDDEVVK